MGKKNKRQGIKRENATATVAGVTIESAHVVKAVLGKYLVLDLKVDDSEKLGVHRNASMQTGLRILDGSADKKDGRAWASFFLSTRMRTMDQMLSEMTPVDPEKLVGVRGRVLINDRTKKVVAWIEPEETEEEKKAREAATAESVRKAIASMPPGAVVIEESEEEKRSAQVVKDVVLRGQ